MTNSKDVEFSRKMLEFYKSSLKGTLGSIKALLDIQREHRDAYEDFKKSKDDPFSEDFINNLPGEYKDKILVLLMMSSKISLRLSNIFGSTEEEKSQLISDLERYIAEFNKLEDEMKQKKNESENNDE